MRRIMVAATLGVLVAASAGADDSVKVGLTEGLFPGMSVKQVRKSAAPFKSLLSSMAGVSGDVVGGGSAAGLAEKLKKGDVQVGVFLGVEFAWAKEANPKLAPVAICVNRSRSVKAVLLVRAASKFKAPDDLRGRVLALPREAPGHTTLFLERKCVPGDATPKKFFKTVARAEDVEEALDDVVNSKASAAVVDALAWSSYRESKPGAAKRLRVLLESEPLPCAVIAYQPGKLTASQVKKLRDGLLGARDTRRGRDLLTQLRLTRFESVPEDYERQLKSAAKAYPPPKGK